MTDLPRPEYWTTLDHLAVEVRRALAAVRKDRVANEARIAASVRKMRWFRRAALLAVAASGLALWAGIRVTTAVNDIQAQRTAARIVACEKDNDTASKINRLGKSFEMVLDIATPPNPSRTPSQQATINKFLADSKAAIAQARIPKRDCSPAAVERFYTKK